MCYKYNTQIKQASPDRFSTIDEHSFMWTSTPTAATAIAPIPATAT